MRAAVIRIIAALAMILTMISAWAIPAAADDDPCTFYPQTGHSICNGFRTYWENNGGLAVFGYPVSDEKTENGRTVQYFERERFEYHPEFKGTFYEVELGLLGDEEVTSRGIGDQPQFQSAANKGGTYMNGHNVSSLFTWYWEHLGTGGTKASFAQSLAIFGYPISEEYWDPVTKVTTQYFERARFEYHPDLAQPYWTELGLLGKGLMGPDQGAQNNAPIVDTGNGQMRVVIAGDGNKCAWNFTYTAQVPDGATLDFPHCGEMRIRGNGDVKITVTPDTAGYATSDHLSWWPRGDGGQVSILKRDGSWTGFISVKDAGKGVDFAQNGGQRKFEVNMSGGSISFLIGSGTGGL